MSDRGDSVFATVWGPVGSVVAALCCLGAAPLLAALTAAGLGFLINDLFLVPLLAAFLGVTIWGLRRDAGRHGSGGPAGLAWLAAFVTVGGLWVHGAVVGLGLVLLVGASVWNWQLVRGRRARDDA